MRERETIGGITFRADDRMPAGWIGVLDFGAGSFAMTNGAVIVHGTVRSAPSVVTPRHDTISEPRHG